MIELSRKGKLWIAEPRPQGAVGIQENRFLRSRLRLAPPRSSAMKVIV